MKTTLLTTLQLFALWSLVSILAGMVLSRILQRLVRSDDRNPAERSEAPRTNGFRPAAFHVWPVGNTDDWRELPQGWSRDNSIKGDAVDATGEVEEAHDPVPVTDWPDDAVQRLWEAVHDGKAFEAEMNIYELRSELDLLGVAGFTNRWKWREQG